MCGRVRVAGLEISEDREDLAARVAYSVGRSRLQRLRSKKLQSKRTEKVVALEFPSFCRDTLPYLPCPAHVPGTNEEGLPPDPFSRVAAICGTTGFGVSERKCTPHSGRARITIMRGFWRVARRTFPHWEVGFARAHAPSDKLPRLPTIKISSNSHHDGSRDGRISRSISR